MKIYFTSPHDEQFENVYTQEVAPKKCGSVTEHLAFALWATQKFANKCRTKDFLYRHEQIKKCFFKHMSKHALTRGLLADNHLLKNFIFTSNNLARELAKCFCFPAPENIAGLVLIERRAFEIPECPVYLTPIKYGIRFQNDPHWYEFKAAEENIFIANANRNPVSPMTRSSWVEVNEVRKFSIGMDDDLAERQADLLSAECHQKIVDYLKSLTNDHANRLARMTRIVLMRDIRYSSLINIGAWVGAASLTYFELSALKAVISPTLQSLGFSERVRNINGFPYLPSVVLIFTLQLNASRQVLNRLGLINQELFQVTVPNIRSLVNAYEQLQQVRQRPAQNNSSVAGLMQRFGLHRLAAAPRDAAEAFSFDGMNIAARLGFR